MEALHPVVFTPLTILSEKRTEPRKFTQFHTISQFKNCHTLANYSKDTSKFSLGLPGKEFRGGLRLSLLLLNSLLGGGLAKALTYEEALQQSASGFSATPEIPDIDVTGIIESVTNFVVDNPVVVGGGAAVLAVSLLVSQVLGNSRPWGVESAKAAYAKLADDENAQLLDIRPPAELRQVGSPDIRGLQKKPVSIAYRGHDKLGFLKKLSLKFKQPENTTLFILDKFDGNSELVAELVTANGFKAAYAIKDGAEGRRGWKNSGLPWTAPKSFSIDISNLTDAIGEAGSDALPLTLAITAAAGLGLLAFTEVETVLQVLGSAALIQVISNKLLFAEDRKKTLKQVDEFLTTKIAPKELLDDVKQIGTALLPLSVTSNALPAVKDAPSKVEAVTQPTSEINSVPKSEVEADSLSGSPTPLSPYPNYPDLRPPTSPIPSQP